MEEILTYLLTHKFTLPSAIVGFSAIFLKYKLWKVPVAIWKGCLYIYSTHKIIRIISEELKPNGGSSLRDAINGIHDQVIVSNITHQVILTQLGIMHWQADSDGKWIWANDHFMSTIGHNMDYMKGNGWINLVHQDDQEYVFSEWRTALTQQRDFYLSFRIISKTNQIIPIEAFGFIVRNGNNTAGYSGYLVKRNDNIHENTTKIDMLIKSFKEHLNDSNRMYSNVTTRIDELEKRS